MQKTVSFISFSLSLCSSRTLLTRHIKKEVEGGGGGETAGKAMKNFMSSLLHRNVRTYGVRLGKERDSRFIFLRCNTQNIPKVRLTARVLFSLFKAIVMLDHFFFFIYKYYSLAAEARKGNNHNLLLR